MKAHAPLKIAAPLLRWYDRANTTLPWRGSADPYRVWLSEIMLQQTRIGAVVPYYEQFRARFPTLQTLAAAPLDEVLKQWEGLGYYSRARNLHKAAQTIAHEWQGQFPATAAALQTLPGIGRYTAAAIASIAFGERVAVLDGNVMRVLARLTDLTADITQPATQTNLWNLATALLPRQRAGDYNQALMDFGRLICTPRQPQCDDCPVRKQCAAHAQGTIAQRPVKKAKAPLPHIDAVAAIIRDKQQQLLLVQRPPHGFLGGLWTFPGGKGAPAEPLAETLQRAVSAEFGLTINVGAQIAQAQQTFTHFRMTLRAYACEFSDSIKLPRKFVTQAGATATWAHPNELDQLSLGKADRAILDALQHWQPRLFEESYSLSEKESFTQRHTKAHKDDTKP